MLHVVCLDRRVANRSGTGVRRTRWRPEGLSFTSHVQLERGERGPPSVSSDELRRLFDEAFGHQGFLHRRACSHARHKRGDVLELRKIEADVTGPTRHRK